MVGVKWLVGSELQYGPGVDCERVLFPGYVFSTSLLWAQRLGPNRNRIYDYRKCIDFDNGE